MHRLTFIRAALRSSAVSRNTRPASVSIRWNYGFNLKSKVQYRAYSVDADSSRTAAKEHKKALQVDWDARILSYDQVKPRTEQPSPDAYLIDVREPDEVIQGSIPSSVNLPLSIIANSLHLNPVTFKEKHGFEKPRKDQEIIFYCRSGKRSASACDVAKRNGFTNIYNYEGSWLDWTEKEKGSKPN
ncbi:Rhodanese-like protein [Rickenella mellea]|uniref:Rhodanese-like protein n=1 Tax=Rickenella mellea TaxID=50990 RepID=A0A4Y7QLN1_9AGAM|nr:Rhodanese-like protein [Rickenella mellea]